MPPITTVTHCLAVSRVALHFRHDQKLPQQGARTLLDQERRERLAADWVRKIDRQIELLDQATRPEDMDIVTYGFHALSGDLSGRYAVTVSRNWCLTFAFEGQDAADVDLEDYHGS